MAAGGENSKPPQYTCHENLMNCIKRQKEARQTYSIKEGKGINFSYSIHMQK